MEQPIWKMIWKFLTRVNILLLYNLATVLFGIFPKKLKTYIHTKILYMCNYITLRAYTNSCPSRWWCHPTISSSVFPFSPLLQSFPASGSFTMSQLFASGDQNTGVSTSASILPMNAQNWFPLGWTGWTSLLSKGLSRVFSNTTVQKH